MSELPRRKDDASASDPPIGGFCDPAFERVRDAFRENFRLRDEIGAAVCVRVAGKSVVDLWGGHRDADRTQAWERDTLVNAYSVGKGIAAMLVLSLVERGELDLDRPVCEVWPEFGVEGKGTTTLRMLLSHQAGLPGVRRPLASDAMYDWTTMASALAEQAPYWEPGSAHGYHVNTFGFLVGEPIVRRLGLGFSQALRTRLTGPSEADYHVGLPIREHRRVATLIERSAQTVSDDREAVRRHLLDPDDTADGEREAMLARTYFNPPGLSGFGCVNTADWRCASIPSTNGHGTARAVAELYDRFLRVDADRGGFVGPGLRAEAREIRSDGEDLVLGRPSCFGLGFQLGRPGRPFGRSPDAFGHLGYGGTLGLADPTTGLALGYLMNRPGDRWHNPRTTALIDAVYDALADVGA